jgi:hypothetical protein
MDALEEANRIRTARAGMKRNLKNGIVHITDLIENPPEFINTMKILDLLVAAPKIRGIKARQILGPYISPTRAVGNLTDAQRDGLVRRLSK